MKRFLVTTMALGLLMLTPGIAHAVDDVTIDVLEAPPQNSVLRGGDVFPVRVQARADSTLKSFALFISVAEEPRPGMKVVNGSASGSWGAGQTSAATLHVGWNTQVMTPYNGFYRVIANAESHLGGTRSATLERYIVDNPPAQVSDVKAELADDAPSLTWPANSEPDLTGYQVYRSTPSSSYKRIASVTGRTFTDKEAPKDIELKYYVVATRRSVAAKEGWIASPPSMVRSFLIPTPSSGSAEAPVISAPQEAPAAPPVPKLEARPGAKVFHQGFEETLPYTGLGESDQVPGALGQEEPEIADASFAAPSPLSLPQVDKPPFIAAALLLIGTAGHLIRLALALFRSSPLPTPASSA